MTIMIICRSLKKVVSFFSALFVYTKSTVTMIFGKAR